MGAILEMTLNENSDKIFVQISGNNMFKIIFWPEGGFPEESLGVDITNLSPAVSDSNNIFSFEIDSQDFGLDKFCGIFYMQSTVRIIDEDSMFEVTSTGLVANIIKYYDCLLDKTLKLKLEGCKQVKNECKDCDEDVFYIGSLISSLRFSIVKMMKEESDFIVNSLEKYCDSCGSCNESSEVKAINGYHYGTEDNKIVLL